VLRSVAFGFLAVLTSPFSLAAQAADSAKASRRPPVITWVDAAVLGAGLAGSIALMNSDEGIARDLQSDRWQSKDRLHDVADVAAVVNEKSLFALGLVTYGVSRLVGAPRTTTDIAWHTTESIFIASASATIVRGLLGRSRPFVTSGSNAYDYSPGKGFAELRYRAYPSIHAASAFATASALTAETARHSRRAAFVVGPIAYSLASLPGLARMYGDKHWASDILMGAALGTVSGWASVRYHHHRPNNWLDRVFIGPVPTVTADRELGLVAGFKF
jgi:membrane-associated phospholipid phosphatase